MKIYEMSLLPEKSEHQVNVWFYIDPKTGAKVAGTVGAIVLFILVIYKRLL